MNHGPTIARLQAIHTELVRVFEDLQLERTRVIRPYDDRDHLGAAIDKVNEIHERVNFLIGHLNDIQRLTT